MNRLDKAKLHADLTRTRYPCIAVTVQDGVVIDETNGGEIPTEHLSYQKVPTDGTYIATEATCGGSCSIGFPKKSCIGKMYSKQKCSVYNLKGFNEDETVIVSVKDLIEVVNI